MLYFTVSLINEISSSGAVVAKSYTLRALRLTSQSSSLSEQAAALCSYSTLPFFDTCTKQVCCPAMMAVAVSSPLVHTHSM